MRLADFPNLLNYLTYENLVIVNTVLILVLYVRQLVRMLLGPRISISFALDEPLGDDTNQNVSMIDGRVNLNTPTRYHVRFLRATVTNNGFYTAHDCQAYLRLPKSLPDFESLNWRHWPREREWMYGQVSPSITREQYLQNIQYKYAVNRKVSLPPKIPKKLDLFLMMSDNSAFVIGERQFTFTPPYVDDGELAFTWKGALRTSKKKIRVDIQTWDKVRMDIADC